MSSRLGFRAPFGAAAFFGVGTCVVTQLLAGCGQIVEVGVDDALISGASSGAGGTLQVGGSPSDGGVPASQGGAPPCLETECRDQVLQCGNCIDDDSDGVIDAFDPDCLGPCDDDENGLSSGMVAMQTATCKQDCYFDGDSGVGNDQCEWSHKCDKESVAPAYPPSGEARCEYDPTQGAGLDCDALNSEQDPICLETCLPLVPNGCDCFGCCELSDGKTHFIGKGRGALGCQREALDDEVACPPCTQVESCLNPCDNCEVCVGRELGAECAGNICPPGQAACTTDAPCDFQEYCVTGCCVRAPEPI